MGYFPDHPYLAHMLPQMSNRGIGHQPRVLSSLSKPVTNRYNSIERFRPLVDKMYLRMQAQILTTGQAKPQKGSFFL